MSDVYRIVIDIHLYPNISDAFADAERIMEVLLTNGYICVFRKDGDCLSIEFEIYDPDGDYGVPNPYWITEEDVAELQRW